MNCLLLPSSRFLLNDDCFCNLLLLLAKNMLLLVLLSGGMVWNCCHSSSRGWGCRNGRCKLKSCMAWNRVRLTRMVMRCLVLLQLSLISVTTLANSANKWLLTYKILWYVVKNTMKYYKCLIKCKLSFINSMPYNYLCEFEHVWCIFRGEEIPFHTFHTWKR